MGYKSSLFTTEDTEIAEKRKPIPISLWFKKALTDPLHFDAITLRIKAGKL
jgi:hypothetical protein